MAFCMKYRTVAEVTIVAILSGGLVGAHADAADVTTNVSATILAPITLQNTGPLQFGDFFVTGVGQVKILASTGTPNSSGGVQHLGGSVSAAAFVVIGGDRSYSIELPINASVENTTNASATMIVNGFEDSKGGAFGVISGGTDSFTVGAVINTTAGQMPGSYTGTFQVTVGYE